MAEEGGGEMGWKALKGDATDTSEIFVYMQNIPDRITSHVRKQLLFFFYNHTHEGHTIRLAD